MKLVINVNETRYINNMMEGSLIISLLNVYETRYDGRISPEMWWSHYDSQFSQYEITVEMNCHLGNKWEMNGHFANEEILSCHLANKCEMNCRITNKSLDVYGIATLST